MGALSQHIKDHEALPHEVADITGLPTELDAKVPYTGATNDVDLGTHTLKAGDTTVEGPNGLGVKEGHLEFTPMTPPTACTATLNATAGNVTGTNFKYKITFVTAKGETNLGTESNTIASASSQRIDLTNIPVGNSKVTSRKIYRVSAAQGNFWYVLIATLANNTDTTYQDNITEPAYAVGRHDFFDTTVGLSGLTSVDIGSTANAGKMTIINTISHNFINFFKHATVTSRQWIMGIDSNADYRMTFTKSAGPGYLNVSSSDNSTVGLNFMGSEERGKVEANASYNMSINPNSQYNSGNLFINNTSDGNVMVGGEIATVPTSLLQLRRKTTCVGTVSTPGSSTTLTGVGTQFLNTFKVGDSITVAGETARTIATIPSNTSLTVTVAFSATPRSAVAYTTTAKDLVYFKANGDVGIGVAVPTGKLAVTENTFAQPALAIIHGTNANVISISKGAGTGKLLDATFVSAQAGGIIFTNTDAGTSLANSEMIGTSWTLSTGFDNYGIFPGRFYGTQTRTTKGTNADLVFGVDAKATSAITTAGTFGYAGRFAAGSVNVTPILAKGFAGQTSNLQEWQKSDASVYMSVGPTGLLSFANGGGMVYGSMYGDNISQTVTVSAVDTYYEVGAGLTGGSCNQFTFQNNKELKCLVAGKYKVDYSLGVQTGVAGQEIESEVMINSTAQSNTSNHTEALTANRAISLSGTGIITLAVDDVVKLSVANHTATNNIIVNHANLTLLQVGA